ncbi:uncharacterized protein C8Q71DRAFT_897577 [Rhodofomes roseus]|uniref:Uncharacterized protein n=1 Tax=Rhodofomes roseus TaxID=34475 RepID=A0ABQ8JWX7_9APHY|nr:uncharacterized protein C8Q71DRAFT_897577 [Rhodofomes roseus]KAH9828543.1 hypothetical protein C8Q71DRAFT_897577 [Rhodofomes roseus]
MDFIEDRASSPQMAKLNRADIESLKKKREDKMSFSTFMTMLKLLEEDVAAHAILECQEFWDSRDSICPPVPQPFDFISLIYALAHESVVRQAPDGRLSVLLNGDGSTDPGAADPASMGNVICWLLAGGGGTQATRSTGVNAASSTLRDAVEKQYRYIIMSCPRASGTFSHRIDCKQIWSETVYMLPPFLVATALSQIRYNNGVNDSMTPAFLIEYGLQQIVHAAKVLQAPSGEWSHIYDFDAQDFKRKAWWGVGNGWACCGIVRVLGMLVRPQAAETSRNNVDRRFELSRTIAGNAANMPLIRQCGSILLLTLRACLKHMRPDGLFHDILDDRSTFVETNLPQMLAYTIFCRALLRRHASGFQLSGPCYLPELGDDEMNGWLHTVEQMRKAAVGKTDGWGFVRDVCGSPRFDKAGTAEEGQAWAIMMEVARTSELWPHVHFPAYEMPLNMAY